MIKCEICIGLSMRSRELIDLYILKNNKYENQKSSVSFFTNQIISVPVMVILMEKRVAEVPMR